MFRFLAISTLILGSALAIVQPQTAAAQDRDDRYRGGYGYNYDRDRHDDYWRERALRERREREWREHERWERRHNRDRYRDYRNGYYDRYGNWHPYGY